MPDKRVYINKDSVWVCRHCPLRNKRPRRVIWTWKNVAGEGTPVCNGCDSDMELDVEATENQSVARN